MNLPALPLLQQLVVLLAALVLFLSFVLLAQSRLVSAIHAFAWQGALVAAVTAVVALSGETRIICISRPG
jgi:hydrogenase-4 component E